MNAVAKVDFFSNYHLTVTFVWWHGAPRCQLIRKAKEPVPNYKIKSTVAVKKFPLNEKKKYFSENDDIISSSFIRWTKWKIKETECLNSSSIRKKRVWTDMSLWVAVAVRRCAVRRGRIRMTQVYHSPPTPWLACREMYHIALNHYLGACLHNEHNRS